MLLLLSQLALAQRTITGTVTDAETGEPLIGANILVAGTAGGTVTDIDGSFSLQVDEAAKSLEVSYTGYTTQTVSIDGLNSVDIQLSAGTVLDEVVVTGYAVERKKDLLGAVAVLDLKDVDDSGNSNILQSMQGRVAGVNVDLSGDPGQGAASGSEERAPWASLPIRSTSWMVCRCRLSLPTKTVPRYRKPGAFPG